MSNELISVMIPAYNAEKYIGRCIESLLNQTYENIEIVIVNDGSKDSTESICESYAKKDNRVRLINQENGGEGAARNTGVQESRGKYLCFVDADDYVKEDFISNMVNLQKANKARMVICGFTELKENEVLNETKGSVSKMSQEEAMEQLLREDSFKGYVWNKMFDLDIIREYNLRFDPSLAVWTDVLFVFKYLTHADSVVFDPTPKYYYIYLETSVSHGDNHVVKPEKSYSAIRAQEQMVDLIPDDYISVKKQMAVRFVQNALATIRNIGYLGLNEENKVLFDNCKKYIRKYRNETAEGLSKKDRILSAMSITCPKLLMLMYKIKG